MRNDSDHQRVEASVNSPLFWLGEYPPPHPWRYEIGEAECTALSARQSM